jgi:hypothetical protein
MSWWWWALIVFLVIDICGASAQRTVLRHRWQVELLNEIKELRKELTNRDKE